MFPKAKAHMLIVTMDREMFTSSNVHFIILSSSGSICEAALAVWFLFFFIK